MTSLLLLSAGPSFYPLPLLKISPLRRASPFHGPSSHLVEQPREREGLLPPGRQTLRSSLLHASFFHGPTAKEREHAHRWSCFAALDATAFGMTEALNPSMSITFSCWGVGVRLFSPVWLWSTIRRTDAISVFHLF